MFAIALARMKIAENEGLLQAGYHLEYLETDSILEQLNYHATATPIESQFIRVFNQCKIKMRHGILGKPPTHDVIYCTSI